MKRNSFNLNDENQTIEQIWENIENLSLAKIVTVDPGAVPVFEKYNLDYCCHGKRTLSEVLSDDQEMLTDVKNELNQLFTDKVKELTIKFDELPLSELIDYIVNNHHTFVKEQSPMIYSHANKIAEKHGNRHPELIKIRELFSEIKNDFELHMMKEEQILFPAIRNIEYASKEGNESGKMVSINMPVSMMESEHERAGNIFDEIRKLTNGYTPPADACTTYRITFEELKIFEFDLHKHVHLENNILFPKALTLQNKSGKLKYN